MASPTKSKRQEARERLDRKYATLREKYFPSDEGQPVKDGEFWEWEQIADEFDREMTAAILEELANLSRVAALRMPGIVVCRNPQTDQIDGTILSVVDPPVKHLMNLPGTQV